MAVDLAELRHEFEATCARLSDSVAHLRDKHDLPPPEDGEASRVGAFVAKHPLEVRLGAVAAAAVAGVVLKRLQHRPGPP